VLCIKEEGSERIYMKGAENLAPEPEFVNILRSPGIDSQPGGWVRPPYLAYRPAWLHRLAESIPGLLKRLQIRALDSRSEVWEGLGPIPSLEQA
jgi:hypothetical protein